MDRRGFLEIALAAAAVGGVRGSMLAPKSAHAFAVRTGEEFSDQSLIQNILTYLYETRTYWRPNRAMTDLLVRGLIRLYETGEWKRLSLDPVVRRFYVSLMQGYPSEIVAYWFVSPTVDDTLRMLLNQTLWLAAGIPIPGMEVTDGQQETALTLIKDALTGGNTALHYKIMTVKVFGAPTEFTPLPEAESIVAECRAIVQAALDRNDGFIGEFDASTWVQLEHQAAAALAGFSVSASPFLVYQDPDGRWSSKIGVAAGDVAATGCVIRGAWGVLDFLDILEDALWGIRSAAIDSGRSGVGTSADENVQESTMWALLALA